MENVKIPNVRTRRGNALTAEFAYRHPVSEGIKTHKAVKRLTSLQRRRVKGLEEAYCASGVEEYLEESEGATMPGEKPHKRLGDIDPKERPQFVSGLKKVRDIAERTFQKESGIQRSALTEDEDTARWKRMHRIKTIYSNVNGLLEIIELRQRRGSENRPSHP